MDDDLWAALEDLAEQDGVSVSDVVREAVRQYLERRVSK